MKWLKEDLAQKAEMDHLVVLHHMPAQLVLGKDWYELSNADELAKALEPYNLIGTLGGHMHMRYISHYAGAPAIMAAGNSQLLYSGVQGRVHFVDAPGYNLISIRQRQMLVQFIDVPSDHRTLIWADITDKGLREVFEDDER